MNWSLHSLSPQLHTLIQMNHQSTNYKAIIKMKKRKENPTLDDEIGSIFSNF